MKTNYYFGHRYYLSIVLILLILGWTAIAINSPSVSGSKDYCEGDSFKADCGPDEVVLMRSVRYGRMRSGGCIASAMAECIFDVLDHFDRSCSGRRNCQLRVSTIVDSMGDLGRSDRESCLKDYRGYLEASYVCIKVAIPTTDCQSSLSPRHYPAHQRDAAEEGSGSGNWAAPLGGFIASLTSRETGCGLEGDPWILRLSTGQRVKLFFYDFTDSNSPIGRRGGGGNNNMVNSAYQQQQKLQQQQQQLHRGSVCVVVAVIKEQQIPATICNGGKRDSPVYTSRGNEVEIRLMLGRQQPKEQGTTSGGPTEEGPIFLLKYEVIGCPTPLAPVNGWVNQLSNQTARFGCNGTLTTWNQTCTNNKWLGPVHNCTKVLIGQANEVKTHAIGWFTKSEWLGIFTVVVVAIAIGIFIFIFGLVLIKRNRHRHLTTNDQNIICGGGGRRPSAQQVYGEFRALQEAAFTSGDYETKHFGLSATPICSNYRPAPPARGGGYLPAAANENDYYRTWQLQRSILAAGDCSRGSRTSNTFFAPMSIHRITQPYDVVAIPAAGEEPRIIEHIYECPTFKGDEGMMTISEDCGQGGESGGGKSRDQRFVITTCDI